MEKEPTNRELSTQIQTLNESVKDILETINIFAGHTEKRFNNLESRFDGLESRFDGLESRFDGLEGRFDGLEGRVTKIEATMVTKDYLDEKLGVLRGDMHQRLRAIGA